MHGLYPRFCLFIMGLLWEQELVQIPFEEERQRKLEYRACNYISIAKNTTFTSS